MGEWTADFIVVGAGSAGAVVASRLSEDPANRVLLIEAGGDDRPLHNPRQFWTNMFIHIPAGFAKTMADPAVNWMYQTEPDVGGRRIHHPRGKILGGSSSINGVLYVRGLASDYDGWRDLGCEGWGWEEVLPFYRKSQHQERGEDRLNGVGGELNTAVITTRDEVSERFITACEQHGLPRNDAINECDSMGAGWLQTTTKNGRRVSSSTAFLHHAMKRPNLKVVTNALVTRVLFDGVRATGVEYRRGGEPCTVRADREVVLSGGAFNSPQLLELSGIGSGERLRSQGIAVVRDLPGVGENLLDHYYAFVTWRLRDGLYSLGAESRGYGLVRSLFEYLRRRRGLLTRGGTSCALYCASRPGADEPDLQLAMAPGVSDLSSKRLRLDPRPGITIAPMPLRPQSRGSVHIGSPSPTVHPRIVANYLSHPEDRAGLVRGMRIARAIMATPVMADAVVEETAPGRDCLSDHELLAYAEQTGGSAYHPVGTCAMGTGPDAVVDPRLRVHGIEGLRVIDASIMPTMVSGNTNAPAIMIGEKGAAMILEDQRRRRLA